MIEYLFFIVEPQEQDRQNMEVLIGNVQFPGLIIPPDADDEAMVELAIALSLQVTTTKYVI